MGLGDALPKGVRVGSGRDSFVVDFQEARLCHCFVTLESQHLCDFPDCPWGDNLLPRRVREKPTMYIEVHVL